jgi:transcriptional regulator with XRE-family HTH domain
MKTTEPPATRPPRTRQAPSVPAVQVVQNMVDVGLQVRAQRMDQSLRIDDAAALTGVSVDLLSRLENGQGSVRTDKLMNVLNGLGLALVLLPKDHPQMQALRDASAMHDEMRQ